MKYAKFFLVKSCVKITYILIVVKKLTKNKSKKVINYN